MSKCDNCKFLYSSGPCADQPYPEILCTKGHWEGAESLDQLSEIKYCEDFIPVVTNTAKP